MARDERVAELVGHDRGEEQQGTQRRDDERLGAVRQDPREVAVQRVDDENSTSSDHRLTPMRIPNSCPSLIEPELCTAQSYGEER